MANDDDMRRLMKHVLPTLYSSFASNPIDIVTTDSLVPSGYLTKDFLENIKTVLLTKRLLILKRWENYFAISCLKALSSHVMYLRYVILACETEIGLSDDIFGGILNVCALVVTFITETLETTGVNFCDLIVHIFMEFYDRNLKEPFCWLGGFERFAVYLKEYLAEEGNFNDDSEVPVTYRVSIPKYGHNKYEEVFEKTHLEPDYITHDDVLENLDCHILAMEVLLNKEIKLPALPSSDELMVRIRANRQRRAQDSKRKMTGTDSKRKTMRTNLKREEVLLTANIALHPAPNITPKDSKHEANTRGLKRKATARGSKRESTARNSKRESKARDSKRESTARDSKRESTSRDSKGESTSRDSKGESTSRDSKGESTSRDSKGESTGGFLRRFSNSQACDMLEQKANIAWCENIVQQVIKYNKSNFSYPTEANKRIQEEAGKILEHIKDTIKSLIEILNKYDEE